MSKKVQAVVAAAYVAFIEKVVDRHGGFVEEKVLDGLIEEKYAPLWSRTDKRPWGHQIHSKWKQNVASAKSALDRKGMIVRFVARFKKGERVRKKVYRVRLPNWIFIEAANQWTARLRGQPKKRYDPLPQPAPVYVVPEIE
jgi:hypothetical protein